MNVGFMKLALQGNAAELEDLAASRPELLSFRDRIGAGPIHYAATRGSSGVIKLIAKAAGPKGEFHTKACESVCLKSPLPSTELNAQDEQGNTPLHCAMEKNRADSCVTLLALGADPNLLNRACMSPLHLAISLQHNALLECDKSTPLHYACTQGAIEAVKLMLSTYSRVENIINITDGALQTPLHRCGAWRTIHLLLSHRANLKTKDKFGCNFVHLAVLQPKGLKNLPDYILQSVKDLLSEEDNEGCTPLHYACRLGIPDSVQNMLGLEVSLGHKSKEKKSALHFAAEYGRINTCHRLLEMMADTRLLNEGDEKGLTPLHLASRRGHTKVVQLLLRKGALFHSDYKGYTCLHHAASEGFTKTMNILLISNINLLDRTNEDGDMALHLAAKEGHTSAVRLLLDRGAEIKLNKNDASFFHEAVHRWRKDTANAVIESERCEEAISMFKIDSAKQSPVMDLIEFLPESCKCLLDSCVKESDDDVNSDDYSKTQMDKNYKYQPLKALNAMVQFNRIELLTHPVCKKYLEMKWCAYGVKAHMLNLTVYSLGLLPLSHLIVNMRPTLDTIENGTAICKVSTSLEKECYFLTGCMFLVFTMSLYAVGKEVVQMVQQGSNYFRDTTNLLDWGAAVMSMLFVVPMLLGVKSSLHWQAGAFAVLVSWMNFLLYLQRFEHFGIYVVMVREVIRSLLCIIVVFFFLMLAFALAFNTLLIGQRHFGELRLSLLQTFVMMVGELNYQDNFLKPFLAGTLPFPFVTYWVFVWFVLFVPILLMNLLIGLAVGDIAEVQRNATLRRIAMQIDLHTNLEEKLPYWIMRRVDQDQITEYPNRPCKSKSRYVWRWGHRREVQTRLSPTGHQLTPLEWDLKNQKYRLKDIASVLEKQHHLLKLIIQKMEISSEPDDHDSPRLAPTPGARRYLSQNSRWLPLLRAVRNPE
ncbi:hypothetical protein AAFF_G00383750 [Aldrovandia affinis]|uniref:Ion transport domain-containing protein n=1 Tax=Aldrovandia affinis TaxID=143900 RepID=A0AAD7WLI8_9TELE|nr:hypothetical protein AAFF_G00383750 [Aldrovandia affinis]